MHLRSIVAAVTTLAVSTGVPALAQSTVPAVQFTFTIPINVTGARLPKTAAPHLSNSLGAYGVACAVGLSNVGVSYNQARHDQAGWMFTNDLGHAATSTAAMPVPADATGSETLTATLTVDVIPNAALVAQRAASYVCAIHNFYNREVPPTVSFGDQHVTGTARLPF